MAPIFENRKIEKNEPGKEKLKVRAKDIILTNLPSQLAGLKVKYDQGDTSLTIKKEGDCICFTGWREFSEKHIKADDEISLYIEDDYCGSAHFRIEVTEKRDG